MSFQPGQSGNPSGRPKGITDKRTELRSLLEPHAKDIFEKLVVLAKAGDPTALKLCVERLLPKIKADNGIDIQIPCDQLDAGTNMIEFAINLMHVVMSGQISIEEADKLINFVKKQQWLISGARSKLQAEERESHFFDFLKSEIP